MHMRKTIIALAVAAATVLPAGAATAAEVPVDDLAAVQGLSAEQLAAIKSFADGGTVAVPGGSSKGATTLAAVSTRRASYYRGSALMWTRDNVDFGYNFSSVTFTSAFQQAGWIWPNISRNGGISKYYNTTRNDRFRAHNTIGAGVPTPWGDVKVYSSDYIHRVSVNHNGAWSAWSD
jgi:hypothetical protein